MRGVWIWTANILTAVILVLTQGYGTAVRLPVILIWAFCCGLIQKKLVGEEGFLCGLCLFAGSVLLYRTSPLTGIAALLAAGLVFAFAAGVFARRKRP